MKREMARRGGASVGILSDADPLLASAVLYLRLWCEGYQGQVRTRNDFTAALGTDQGTAAVEALSQICYLCVRYGRRPLMCHHVACECLGADENCFANFIACAAEGEREDAMLIATLMARADLSPSLTGLAQQFGLALKRMPLRAPAVAETVGHHIPKYHH